VLIAPGALKKSNLANDITPATFNLTAHNKTLCYGHFFI
jgi:hypothetical protein